MDHAASPAEPSAEPHAGNAAPLVSVLVRSIDRAMLDDALASVALQTHPHVEVVVAAARPGHRALPDRCGNFPLRLAPTDVPLHRSAAANRLLQLARGEYLLFLDDDDWLAPGHLARLATVLGSQPKARVAYTGVTLVDDQGDPVGQTMDLPFDSVRQLAGNITPIHAVMFERSFCDEGARFDEALDHYEDWDFWLQLARRTTFVHVPGASAFYRIHASSGVHVDAGAANAASGKIFDKWQGQWTAAQRARLMERAWATDDACKSLEQANAAVDQLQGVAAEQHSVISSQSATLAQQQGLILAQQQAQGEMQAAVARLQALNENLAAQLHVQESRIADFTNSTSWKITAPLRRLSRVIRRR